MMHPSCLLLLSLWGMYFDVGCFSLSGPASPGYTAWPDFSIFILWQYRNISRTQYKNSLRSNCERVVKETSLSHMHRPPQSPDLNPIEIFWDVLCKTSCSPIINAKLWMETNVVTLPKFIRDSNVTGDLGRFWSMWLFLFCRADTTLSSFFFFRLLPLGVTSANHLPPSHPLPPNGSFLLSIISVTSLPLLVTVPTFKGVFVYMETQNPQQFKTRLLN